MTLIDTKNRNFTQKHKLIKDYRDELGLSFKIWFISISFSGLKFTI